MVEWFGVCLICKAFCVRGTYSECVRKLEEHLQLHPHREEYYDHYEVFTTKFFEEIIKEYRPHIAEIVKKLCENRT